VTCGRVVHPGTRLRKSRWRISSSTIGKSSTARSFMTCGLAYGHHGGGSGSKKIGSYIVKKSDKHYVFGPGVADRMFSFFE